MKIKMLKAALAGLALSVSGFASAGLIFQADSAITTAGHQNIAGFGYINNVINQDSFSVGYVSAVTDFNSFVSSTNAIGGLSTYGSFLTPFPMSFDFSFNQLLNLDSFALWNQAGSATLNLFELYASESGSFNDLTFLGSYDAAAGNQGQSFSFAATNLKGVRMKVLSNEGYSQAVRFREVAFGGQTGSLPVTEPSTLAIFALGFMGLVARRFKKQ